MGSWGGGGNVMTGVLDGGGRPPVDDWLIIFTLRLAPEVATDAGAEFWWIILGCRNPWVWRWV